VLSLGDSVCVTETSGGWAKTDEGNYVSSKYLTATKTDAESTEAVTESSTTTSCSDYYTTADLSVRSGPGTAFSRVEVLSKGSKVCVVSISNSWALTEDGNYCSSVYLTSVQTVVNESTSTGDLRKCPSFWNTYATTRYPKRSEFATGLKTLVKTNDITYNTAKRWTGISDKVCPPSLPSYADCSSFTTWAFWTAFGGTTDLLNNAKWASGNTTSLRENGSLVSTTSSGCQEGDLILYSGHVTTYVGNNQVVNYGSDGPVKLLTYNSVGVTVLGCYRYDFPFGESF
jgi:hypothetical protein